MWVVPVTFDKLMQWTFSKKTKLIGMPVTIPFCRPTNSRPFSKLEVAVSYLLRNGEGKYGKR